MSTNTDIDLQLLIWKVKYLGLCKARHFLAACVVWETTWLYSQLKVRHQLYCFLCEVSCVSLILKEEKRSGKRFTQPVHKETTLRTAAVS